MTSLEVFEQNDGSVTKSYYEELNALGMNGQLAVALFRAVKRSTAAKRYRGRSFTRAAYDVKNWSLSEICRILKQANAETKNGIVWGWKRDPNTPGYEWVLYVETPFGQVSFHSAERMDGPDFPNQWDGARLSRERILRYCDSVMGLKPVLYPNETTFDGPVTVVAPQLTLTHEEETPCFN